MSLRAGQGTESSGRAMGPGHNLGMTWGCLAYHVWSWCWRTTL